jgi:lipoprotein-anchoring transpeptidase ErfK/SrfK
MKGYMTRVISLILALVLLTCLPGAMASGDQTAGIKGHWAEQALRQALQDSLISGTETDLRPDDSITKAEAVAILCRVFQATKKADLSDLSDVKKSDWFYTAAAEGVAMGMIEPVCNRLDLDRTITRGQAFALFAKAFQRIPAQQESSALNGFSDGETTSGVLRQATAALVAEGILKGSNGSLQIDGQITRAEFLTVLYRMVSAVHSSGKTISGTSGTVLSGNTVKDTETTGTLYFDCSTSAVALNHVTAPEVVLRSNRLDSVTTSFCRIDRLVIAAQEGDITLQPDESSQINTVEIGDGGGCVTLNNGASNLEVTGGHREIVLSGDADTLMVSGSDNTIRLEPGVTVNSVKILSSGSGNTLIVNGTVKSLIISGKTATIDGSGTAEEVNNYTSDSKLLVTTGSVTVHENDGLDAVEMTLSAPDTLPAGEALNASAIILCPTGAPRRCQIKWYLNDRYLSGGDYELASGTVPKVQYQFQYSKDMPKYATLTAVLTAASESGADQELRAEKSIRLENYSDDDYKQQEVNRVLALVTTGYQGNYTLSWAKSHDYAASDKELWINAKGYSSKTNYLIWVSIAFQRVNVFTGLAGQWKLQKTFLVGTGATGKDTPTGVWNILYKQKDGWTSETYTVKPVVNFIDYSYGFHSRLYHPGTTKLEDARIGYPISHGCVRMYDDDIAWIYQTIPFGTTVVVY